MSIRVSGGILRGRTVPSPRGSKIRPTTERVRLALFSILGEDIIMGSRILDLFAGTGMLGIEAMSRGAGWSDFVEVNRKHCGMIRNNLSQLGVTANFGVYQTKVENFVNPADCQYDLVLADPPFDIPNWESIMTHIDKKGLVIRGGVIVAEHRHTVLLNQKYGRLELYDDRRYGDSRLSFYTPTA